MAPSQKPQAAEAEVEVLRGPSIAASRPEKRITSVVTAAEPPGAAAVETFEEPEEKEEFEDLEDFEELEAPSMSQEAARPANGSSFGLSKEIWTPMKVCRIALSSVLQPPADFR